MLNVKTIHINKNRGWRGLAEAILEDELHNTVYSTVFSFSPEVWTDLMAYNKFVAEDEENYYVLTFTDPLAGLPRGHQRSVLIKNFTGVVTEIIPVPKEDWWEIASNKGCRLYINNFKTNSNNHTTSDWNCVGIRVMPTL